MARKKSNAQTSLLGRLRQSVASYKRKRPRVKSRKKTVGVSGYSRSWPPVRKRRK